jgi:hypothetical protein
MSCNCSGSANFATTNELSRSVFSPLPRGDVYSTGVTAPVAATGAINPGFRSPLVPIVNSGRGILTFTSAPIVATTPMSNYSAGGVVGAAPICTSLATAMFTTLNPVEQSFTYNPQVTSVPGASPIVLSSAFATAPANFVPSFATPIVNVETGFNYFVGQTPTFVNTCI